MCNDDTRSKSKSRPTSRHPEPAGSVPDLLGLAETAELLALSKGALGERRRRSFRPGDALPSFPAPLATLRCGPIWLREQIEEYKAECERLAGLSWFERCYGEADDPIGTALGRVEAREAKR